MGDREGKIGDMRKCGYMYKQKINKKENTYINKKFVNKIILPVLIRRNLFASYQFHIHPCQLTLFVDLKHK